MVGKLLRASNEIDKINFKKNNCGSARLTFEETMTILAEIENVLNHRLLTYVSDDISNPVPLAPVNFLSVGHKDDCSFNFSESLNSSIPRESLLNNIKPTC
ncbi:hypothetical protein TNIN_240651 [Trichonephila inaurata madagascariensis]|uniref:Uncharacterized protein n=1 Tax=Trichonephila inaurata madagascariensis TaxID=2747483 RepID=A0A8X6ITV8_9ARAC|nr:hypothetical protein TNIN_240651 [Trichonephila inaurata madagascariensis]